MTDTENEFVKVKKENELTINVDIGEFNLLEIDYKDEGKGIDAHGRLFVSDSGKLEFEGDAEESAKVLFVFLLKPMCEKYIKELNEN